MVPPRLGARAVLNLHLPRNANLKWAFERREGLCPPRPSRLPRHNGVLGRLTHLSPRQFWLLGLSLWDRCGLDGFSLMAGISTPPENPCEMDVN